MKIWLCIFAAAISAVAQTPYKAPRTAEGKPDISGIWFTQAFAAAWDIEDHPTVPNIVGGPSIIIDPPDKKIPYQAWGPAKRKDLIENHAFDDPQAHCYSSGIPRVNYAPFGFEFTQSPGLVVMMPENFHMYRMIPTNDNSPRLPAAMKLFNGESTATGTADSGRRRHEPEWQDLARHGREFHYRCPACRRALYAHRRWDSSLRSDAG